MSKTTMTELARLSGVSNATVSRALRSPHLVSDKTLATIQEVIKKNKLKVNIDFPEKNSNRTIGVIVPSTLSNAFAETLFGIQEESLKDNYTLMVGVTHYEVERERKLLNNFREKGLAGLIIAGFSPRNEKAIRKLSKSGIPCIIIWEKNNDTELSYIGFDNYKAFYQLGKYLIDLGHTRIGLICGPYSKNERAYKRLTGYRSALEEFGLEYNHDYIYEDIPSLQAGENGMKKIMSAKNPPSAVIGGADVLAIGAISAANSLGLNVPKDVSIVGIDNIPFASYTVPPLTTIAVEAYEIGVKAVEAITWAKTFGDGTPRHVQYEGKLIERESCAPFN